MIIELTDCEYKVLKDILEKVVNNQDKPNVIYRVPLYVRAGGYLFNTKTGKVLDMASNTFIN